MNRSESSKEAVSTRPKSNASSERQTTTRKSWSTRESKCVFKLKESRRYLILEDQCKQMNVEFNEKKDKIKEMIPSEEDFHL